MKVTVRCARCKGELSGMCRECNGWGVVTMSSDESVVYVNETILRDLDGYVQEIDDAYDPDDRVSDEWLETIVRDLELISMVEAHEWLDELQRSHLPLYWQVTDLLKSRRPRP